MITNEEIPAPTREATLEEESLLERASAPTLCDLRGAAQELFTATEAEPNRTPPNDRRPQQAT